VFVNVLTTILSLAGFLYYTVIYTMWLKRRTPQNIVIGGGAGAIPPMIGWSAVTGNIGWPAVIMFAIIFFWTPPHFWPLAIAKNDDYARAGTFVLLLASFGLYFTGAVGGLYLAVAIISGLAFLFFHIRMWYEPDERTVWARRTFFASLIYLPILFSFMAIDSLL
jgi:protoheme IX farnesyltransferase